MKSAPTNLFLHADGDSFFVSCELTLRPDLRGKPVIVGEDKGIAVAMSPEAKKLGVTRGMPIFRIKKLFPEVVTLPHHFDLYHNISNQMFQILQSYCQTIEVYSVDECFAIVEPSEIKFFGSEKKFMLSLKNEIEKKLGVTYSLGLARTKSLAKQASKLEKPGGLVMLLSKEDENKALQKTPINDIWGIGRQTVPRLQRLGLKNAFDFVNLAEEKVKTNFSEPVYQLYKDLKGEEMLEVEGNYDPRSQKSIQSTSTFHPSSNDPKIIFRELSKNVEHACENARAIDLVSNKISFFVKTSSFIYFTYDAKFNFYTSDPGVILNAIESIFPKLLKTREKIRSTGITLQNLMRKENVPLDLFGKQEKELKFLAVEEVADKIRQKFGKDAIKRVASIK